MKRSAIIFIAVFLVAISPALARTSAKAAASLPEDKLPWWPTDAQPAPVKDDQRGGFWWWPSSSGTTKDLWGNRGYAYVNKIIYDWNDGRSMRSVQVNISDVGFVAAEKRPSLLIKRTIRSLKLRFKDNTAEIKPEHAVILQKAFESLKLNKDASVLVAIHNDTLELGRARTQAVEKHLMDLGVVQDRINVLASEKLQQAGLSAKQPLEPGTVQLIVAEVKEVLIPGP
jgi:outer membrane protein OmpA-like peptidoglycan-associated protein